MTGPAFFTWSHAVTVCPAALETTLSRADFPVIIELAAQNRLNMSYSVTRELPLKEINRGFEMLRKKEENLIRLVVTFP